MAIFDLPGTACPTCLSGKTLRKNKQKHSLQAALMDQAPASVALSTDVWRRNKNAKRPVSA